MKFTDVSSGRTNQLFTVEDHLEIMPFPSAVGIKRHCVGSCPSSWPSVFISP